MYKISDFNIMTQKQVEDIGIEFLDTSEITWGGEWGQQLLDRDEEEGGKPINGLVYEKFENGKLDCYCTYIKGIKEGVLVQFYENGDVKKYTEMCGGSSNGICVEWYENNKVKIYERRVYGVLDTYTKWDEQGNILEQATETVEKNKGLINKYKEMYDN